MDIYLAFMLFTFIIVVYWVITELFTLFFSFTGLPSERARFQVISLLTGTGFTTRESQVIMSSRRRRHLARYTMLFGYVFNITILSAFINVFLSMKVVQAEQQFIGFLIPLGTLAVIFILMRVPQIRGKLDNWIRRIADRIFDRHETFNAVMLIDNISTETIARVTLRHIPDEYRGLTLADTRLRADTGITVMLVERNGGKPEAPHANTVFEIGDKLTVFGDYKTICKSFHAKEHFTDD